MSNPPSHQACMPQAESPLVIHFQLSHDAQKLSPLFSKLSAELRNKIFDYALTFHSTGITSEDLFPCLRAIRGPRKVGHTQTHLALLQTCRKIYIATHLTPLQLSTLTYKIHDIFSPDAMISNNDRLLWTHQWQRGNLRSVHVYGIFFRFASQETYVLGISPSINSLPSRLESLTMLHISIWGLVRNFGIAPLPSKFDVDLGFFKLADLPNHYPTLREVIIEFGIPVQYEDLLDRLIIEVASKDLNSLQEHNLFIDHQSVQNSDWITKFNGKGPPEGMSSRGMRWFAAGRRD